MNAAQYTLILCVRLYRLVISPAKVFVVGPAAQCRFTPSCSVYALEAVSRHGALLGSWHTLKRIARCHPWGGCGCDPVPDKVQRPKSNVQSRTSNVQRPTSKVQSPRSKVQSPRSKVQSPKFLSSAISAD